MQPYGQVHGAPAAAVYPPQPQPQQGFFPNAHISGPQQGFFPNANIAGPQQGFFPNANISGPQQMSQPAPVQVVPDLQKPAPQHGVWTTGIFGCMEDPLNVVVALFFPCITFGQVAEILDKGQTSCCCSGLSYCCAATCGCACFLTGSYRTRLRVNYGLPESPCADGLTHYFCDPCALSQEYRELRNRGLDPQLGWQGNMLCAQARTGMAPPGNQFISRG
ncbi:unnamed protein product [Victoria cruziana]